MQIVTDAGMDLSPEQAKDIPIHIVPLSFTLDGKTYRSGIDIQAEAFYPLIASTKSYPTTSQPAVGEIAEIYRKVAVQDPDILSIHISSGLSGTYNVARLAAEEVPEANITLVDTKTLSGAQGWQVEAAARALKAGRSKEEILKIIQQVSDAANTVYTLATLDYLIHGGRISHLKGLLANVLDIKPLIAVEKVGGTYVQEDRARSLKKATLKITDVVGKHHAPGTKLRVQIMHGNNPEGVELLKARFDELYQCEWLPSASIAPVLGAHTGPGLVGAVYAAVDAYPAI